MVDCPAPLRPADSWSSTEVRSLTHNHVWTIKGFSQCECRYLETSTKIRDLSTAANSAVPTSSSNSEPPSLTFRIRLHPQGNKESNKDFTFFQCFSNQPSQTFRAKFKFTVFNARNEEIATTVYSGTQQLHGYFEYIRRDLLVNHVLPDDELQLNLELSVTFDTVTKTSQMLKPVGLPTPKYEEVCTDIMAMLSDPKLSDFVIAVGEKEIRTHKVILSARSPVFAAMLGPHTEESKTSRVTIEDVEYDTMMELIHFIYSGRSPNIGTMGLDVLAAADRFQLPGLKAMADQALRCSLSVENACRMLLFADMYNSCELKNDSLRYITQNIAAIINSDGWQELAQRNADLVTEVVMQMSNNKSSGPNFSSSVTGIPGTLGEPPMKRSRTTPPAE